MPTRAFGAPAVAVCLFGFAHVVLGQTLPVDLNLPSTAVSSSISYQAMNSIVAPCDTQPCGSTTGNYTINAGAAVSFMAGSVVKLENGFHAAAGSAFHAYIGLPPTPVISSLTPASGPVGTVVTIAGTNFGTTTGTVTFGGATASVSNWTPTSIVTTVPAGAASGNVVVIAGGMPSTGAGFNVLPTPSISSLTPSSGPMNIPVTIAGSNFGTTVGSVTFNGVAATVSSWDANSIVVYVPPTAMSGNVVVTAGGVPSNAVSFTVLVPPHISSLTPTSGPVGTSVTIAGTSFGAVQGASTVKFNGTAANVNSWSDTGIVAVVPPGTTTGAVVVTVDGLDSNGVAFALNPPLWSIASTPSGNFTRGQTGAYTLTVSNQSGAGSSAGLVTVTDSAPSGITLVSMSGTGWACPPSGNTCTRSDSLAGGASYPPITVAVNVSASAVSPLSNQVRVEGGGASNPATGSDSTVVVGTPISLLASPQGAIGHNQTFLFRWSDPQSYSNISSFQVRFGDQSTSSCWIRFTRAAGQVYLHADDGTEMAAATLGSNGTVSNSQCAVNLGESSLNGGGDQLLLTLSMAFYNNYSGAKSIWMEATNGTDSGWGNPMGTYTVSDSAPWVDGVSPTSGRGWSQTFTFTFTDVDGASDLYHLQVNFGNSTSAAHSCFVTAMPGSHAIYLMDDNGNPQSPIFARSAGSTGNSQCGVDGAQSSIDVSGNNVTLNLAITFTEAYAGAQTIWARPIDTALVDPGWGNKGSWTVGPLYDFTVSVTPASRTLMAGQSTTFTINVNTSTGLGGPMTFNYSGLPSGATASFTALTNGTSTMTVTTAKAENGGPAAEYDFTITGLSGGVARSTTAHLSVQDFTISLSPEQIKIYCSNDTGWQGLDADVLTGNHPVFWLTVNGVNGFIGSVAPLPVGAGPGLYVGNTLASVFNIQSNLSYPPIIWANNGGIDQFGLWIYFYNNHSLCDQTNFSLTARMEAGTSQGPGVGNIRHVAEGALDVNFGVAASVGLNVSPAAGPSQNVAPGASAHYSIRVPSLFGYTGSANLSISGLPAGWTATFYPQTVSVNPFTPGYSDLVVASPATATPGTSFSFSVSAQGAPTQPFETRGITVIAGPPQITLTTAPPGLSLTVTDPSGQTTCGQTPCSYIWSNGTSVTVNAPSPQAATGARYVFQNWTDGATQQQRTIGIGSQPAAYTASFKKQYLLSATPGPGGGSIVLSPASPDGWYDEGTTVTISASSLPGYHLTGFTGAPSNGVVTMDASKTVVANFAPDGTISIITSPPGLPVTVGGSPCGPPCNLPVGHAYTIAVAQVVQSGTAGQRYYFLNWSNGTNPTTQAQIQISEVAPPGTYTAAFKTQYQLTVTPSPASGAGSVTMAPSGMPDAGWFDQGTTVTLTPTANPSYQFLGFTGGTVSSNAVTMSGPVSLMANFGTYSTVIEYIRINGRVIAVEKQ